MFEEAVGEDFLGYAYMPEYRLARQLFYSAVDRLHSNEDKDAADEFFEEWTELYDIDVFYVPSLRSRTRASP